MFIPEILKIETTSHCNARCPMCSHRFIDPKRLMDIPLKTVENLLDEASIWKASIQFSGIGEPTLYPHLVEVVKYCREKGMSCSFNTNGMLMTPDLTEKLVKARLSSFLLAVDGRDKETYEKIRVGLDFETVKYNIKEAWRICQSSRTKMRLLHVKTKENQHDIENILKYWQSYAHQSTISVEVPLALGHPDAIEHYNRHAKRRRKGSACRRPWDQLIVRANGDVPLCCTDLTDEHIMGNIYENKLLEAFNSPKFNSTRKRMKKGDIPELCRRVCVKT